jgi:hypothetical protein
VLAWGYDRSGTDLTLHLYDPNHPDRDTTMGLSLDAHAPLGLVYETGEPTRGFFLSRYAFAEPPIEKRDAPARTTPLSALGALLRTPWGRKDR